MYFNFEDNRPDTPRIPQPLSRREVVLLTINLHAFLLILILLGPRIPWVREVLERRQQEIEEQARLELEKKRDQARFVFVQPRIDTPAKPPPIADLSDQNRRAATVERAPKPTNPLPFSRGNSPEMVETAPPATPQPPAGAAETSNGPSEPPKPPATSQVPQLAMERPVESTRPGESKPMGTIADAIRNVQRYAQQENFQNPRGGEDQNVSESIQFDSKGIDFGPWLRRFVAQVRRNWMIPQAAMMSMHGNVAITFVIHRDGRITDVTVARPSSVNAFTLSARNAILTSNPTIPLPPEYPDDKMPIMVTFYFNEDPYGR
jgi:TonB family protein